MRVVMTGGSKGIGLVAAQQLLAQPGVQLLLGVNQSPAPAGAKTLPLKLDSLTDTRRFAADVVAWLAGARIDALLLNAGGQRPDVVGKSADGHELTFAIKSSCLIKYTFLYTFSTTVQVASYRVNQSLFCA